VEGTTPGDKVEDGVGCLPPLRLVGSLRGGRGIGCRKLSIPSCSKSVSHGSGTSSSIPSFSNTLASSSYHSYASSMIGLVYLSHPQPKIAVDIDHAIETVDI